MINLNLDKKIHEEKIEPNENVSGNISEQNLISKFNFSIKCIKDKFSLLKKSKSSKLVS